MMPRSRRLLCGLGLLIGAVAAPAGGNPRPANVVIVSVDTLRADRLSSYGYPRNTSPNIDRLLAQGVRFTQARTVEPLTAPALASLLVSLPPHEHGSTRNGLRVRPDLPSLPRLLRRHGYISAAFVGSWTLRRRLWGMAEHFGRFEEVLTEARWLGMVTREARAEHLNERALDWLAGNLERWPDRPFLLWVHYVEPHSPYELQEGFLRQIGPAPEGDERSKSNRYDSEIAYVDFEIANLLAGIERLAGRGHTMTVFVADHGESLGEHDYWGHGRNLFEPGLRIPMGITWPDRVSTGTIDAPALITDLAPTIVGLLGFEVPSFFQGFDWTPVIDGNVASPRDRVTLYQAHRGAVTAKEDQTAVRERGLLEVARIAGSRKELHQLRSDRLLLFDLAVDPQESDGDPPPETRMSEGLAAWLEEVRAGLKRSDDLPPPSLGQEDLEALRALGYLD